MTDQGGFTGGFIGVGRITVGGLAAVPEPTSLALLAPGVSRGGGESSAPPAAP
jgi:hypothetical protein